MGKITTTSVFMFGRITSSFYFEVRAFLAARGFPAVPALLLLYATNFAFTFRRYPDVNDQSLFFLLTFLNGIGLS